MNKSTVKNAIAKLDYKVRCQAAQSEQISINDIPHVPIVIANLLKELGLSDSDCMIVHHILIELENEGSIMDLSTSNGGFGCSIGADNEKSYSLGAKIQII